MGWWRNTTKRTKKRDKRQQKDAKKLIKRAGKSATTLGENAEISARMALKIRKMSPTEHSKMPQKYKF